MGDKNTRTLSYTDRFGHTWRIKASALSESEWRLVFTNGNIRLRGAEPVDTRPRSMSHESLKDAFCDAERVLVDDGETWYVGYRERAFGRGGRSQGGLCTRFRAESGEVRFSRSMLDFRHMSSDALKEHLATAQRSTVRVVDGDEDE